LANRRKEATASILTVLKALLIALLAARPAESEANYYATRGSSTMRARLN
jgi:hypothetical protein